MRPFNDRRERNAKERASERESERERYLSSRWPPSTFRGLLSGARIPLCPCVCACETPGTVSYHPPRSVCALFSSLFFIYECARERIFYTTFLWRSSSSEKGLRPSVIC